MRAEVAVWRNRVETIRGRLEPLRERLEATLLYRVWERLLENEFLDRAVALGAKAFVSLFPSLIVVAAFAPASVRVSIITTLTHRLGLSGAGLTTVKQAFEVPTTPAGRRACSDCLFTFFYISSFTTALRRVYAKAWRRPSGGFASGYAVGAVFLAGLAAYFAVLGGLRSLLDRGAAIGVFVVLAWLAAVGLWLLTPWLMLARQVRARALLPSAVLTATGSLFYTASSTVWMPRTITENQHQFGFFGVALSLVTWLTGAATIVVVSACAAPVLAEDQGWIGRLIRGGRAASTLVEGAAESTAAPASAPRLSNAFGIGGPDDDDDDDDDLGSRS